VLAFYLIQLDSNFLHLNPPGVQIQEPALHAATWGTVGGILRGLWFLKNKVSARKYENSLRIYFLSVPFLGGLFGAIIYFILLAGVFVLAPTQTPAIFSENQTASGPIATTTNITSNATEVSPAPATTSTPNATEVSPAPATTSTPNATEVSPAPATTTMTNITSNATEVSPAPAAKVPTLAIIPLAALAGYNWEWAVMVFNRIGDSFKERKEEEKEEEKEE
jgi:cytoskeletal protein RodZ